MTSFNFFVNLGMQKKTTLREMPFMFYLGIHEKFSANPLTKPQNYDATRDKFMRL
jgi:hypothetical protein